MDVQEKLGQGHGGETGERASSRSCKQTKSLAGGVAGAVAVAGENNKKGGGGVCGKHTLKDLLTVDHEQTSKSYQRSKREHIQGAQNIAVNRDQ